MCTFSKFTSYNIKINLKLNLIKFLKITRIFLSRVGVATLVYWKFGSGALHDKMLLDPGLMKII